MLKYSVSVLSAAGEGRGTDGKRKGPRQVQKNERPHKSQKDAMWRAPIVYRSERFKLGDLTTRTDCCRFDPLAHAILRMRHQYDHSTLVEIGCDVPSRTVGIRMGDMEYRWRRNEFDFRRVD